MPADYTIRPEHKVVFSYGWGVLTFGDIRTHRAQLLRDDRFSRDFRQVVHLSDAKGIEISSDEIRILARETLFAPESRRALVGGGHLPYGLFRMFDAYTDEQTLRVFRTIDDAMDWLGLPRELGAAAIDEIRLAQLRRAG